MFSFFSCNFTMHVFPCDIHHRINRLVCCTMAIFAGFTSYVVSVMKALPITYITGKNWISLLSEYKLNPYAELQFGLTKTPQLVLLAFKRNEEKNWITITDPSQVRKLIIADQTRSPLSRTDRAPAVALALTAAAAQSDPAMDWAPTASADQSDLPEDRASTPAPAPTPALALQGAPSPAAAAASAPAPTLALASAPARAVAPATDWAAVRTSYTKVLTKTDMSTFLVSIGRPSASFFFLSMLFHMIHCVHLTVWVCLLVCKQRIPRATRESFNNPGDRGQVSLTMRSLGVNEPAQYTVSTKDGRMMIDAKGWSRFKSKSYLAVGDDVKIELSRQGELVQINFEILQ
jgi:hypothetical protein